MKKIASPDHSCRFHLSRRDGFSLVEVTLALGIAAFCMLAIFGLIPVGLSSNQAAVIQTEGAGVASQVAADLEAAAPSSSASVTSALGFKIPAPGGAASTNPQVLYFTEAGQKTGSVGTGTTPTLTGTGAAFFRANVGFTPPGSGQRKATTARILITWPAVGTQTSGWPTTFTGSFEGVTALNRN